MVPGRASGFRMAILFGENRFQSGRKSALSGCNSHFHMYVKTQLGRCAARKSAF